MLKHQARRLGFCLSHKKRKKLNFLVFVELCRKRGIEAIQFYLNPVTAGIWTQDQWQPRGVRGGCRLQVNRGLEKSTRKWGDPTPPHMRRRSRGDDPQAWSLAQHWLKAYQIDLTQPLEEQGPFDVIIHKLSDLMLEAAQEDSRSQQLLQRFQDYVDSHPRTVLLNPLPAMSRLADRFQSYKLIQELQTLDQGNHFSNPPYVELATEDQQQILHLIKERQLSFPLICKTRVAQGSSSHNMALIFSEDGLQDISLPCVLQSFINHNAVLYKVFVVGRSHFVVRRPSLKNFAIGKSERETIFFNSHEVSKPESCSHLTERDEQDNIPSGPSDSIIKSISRCLQMSLGLSLFGVDIIVDSTSGKLAVIDINAFPGYEDVPEFFSTLLDHMETLLGEQEKNLNGAGASVDQPAPLLWGHRPQDSPPNSLMKDVWMAKESPVGKRPLDSACFQELLTQSPIHCQSSCD